MDAVLRKKHFEGFGIIRIVSPIEKFTGKFDRTVAIGRIVSVYGMDRRIGNFAIKNMNPGLSSLMVSRYQVGECEYIQSNIRREAAE